MDALSFLSEYLIFLVLFFFKSEVRTNFQVSEKLRSLSEVYDDETREPLVKIQLYLQLWQVLVAPIPDLKSRKLTKNLTKLPHVRTPQCAGEQ